MQLERSIYLPLLIHLLASLTSIHILSPSCNRFWKEHLKKMTNNSVTWWKPIQTWFRVTFGKSQFLKSVLAKTLNSFSWTYWRKSWSAWPCIVFEVQLTTTIHMFTPTQRRILLLSIETGHLFSESKSLTSCKETSMKWSRGKERSNSETQTIEILQHPALLENTWEKVDSSNSSRTIRRTNIQLRCHLTQRRIPTTMKNKRKRRPGLFKSVQLLMTKKMFSLECAPPSTNLFRFRRSQGH